MTAAKPKRHQVNQHVKQVARVALGCAVSFAFTSAAWAQAVQNLTIGFVPLGTPVSASAVPMSNWASAGIAAIVALTAFFVLRRRGVRGGRFFGAMLAIVAGATMLSIAGQRLISEARAVNAVTIINLSISPTTNVGGLFPNPGVTAVVDNTIGQSVRITSITLDPGAYSMVGGSTCSVSLVLAAGGTCSIELAAS